MSISQSLLKSSAVLFAGRFLNRTLGLISTLILARALTPEDFGIVAIASITVFFFDAISHVGMREYLLQKDALSNSDIETAWTLNLATKCGVWIIFLVATPFIAKFYEQDQLLPVLLTASLILPLLGLESAGIILAEKQLNYIPIFKTQLIQKLASLSVMLVTLTVIQSYWVIVMGLLGGVIIRIISSYITAPYKIKISTKNIKEQWIFSRWLLPKGTIGYIKSELDSVIVSKIFGLASLGGFNLTKSLVNMIGRDIVQPATDPLLSAFSKAKNDDKKLGFQIVMSLWIITLLILPICHYLYTFSKTIVLTLYGDQWTEYSDTLSGLAPLVYFFATSGILFNVLISHAKVKQLFFIETIAMIVTAFFLLYIPFHSLSEFALARSLLSCLFWIVTISYARLIIPFSLTRLALLQVPPITASSISIYLTQNILFKGSAIETLLVSGVFFITTYLILLFGFLVFFRKNFYVHYLSWFLKNKIINVAK